jgi:hypothetical protein
MDEFRGLDHLGVLDELEPRWRSGQFERFADVEAVVVHGQAPGAAMSVAGSCSPCRFITRSVWSKGCYRR